MKFRALAAAGTLLLIGAAANVDAKMLIYCSEGSPENFNPMINTTGTTFDANLPIYNRLVEFKIGTTEVRPGLAESWDISEDGKTFTFHLRRNVKWHSNKNFKPTRDFNADDVLFSFERQWKPEQPLPQGLGRQLRLLQRHGLAEAARRRSRRSDDYTVVHAERAERAVPGRPRHGFRGDPVEGIRRRPDEGGHSPSRSTRSRSAPARSSSSTTSEDATIRYRPFKRLLGTEAEDRRARVRDHQGPGRSACEAAGQRMPGHGLPEPGRSAGDEERSQPADACSSRG